MKIARTYSRFSLEACTLLAKQIQLARKQRRWSEHELADRAGISRATLQKIEKGDMSCAIGLVFEVAVLVGIKLYEVEYPALIDQIERTQDKITLLPKRIHHKPEEVDDDF